MDTTIRIFTDMAEICVFDPARLKHRMNDPADWSTIDKDALAEINQGNVILLGVGSDGFYTLHVRDHTPTKTSQSVSLRLGCPTGELYIGPSEMVTGGGLEPEIDRGENARGRFISMPPGNYLVEFSEAGVNEINIVLMQITNTAQNQLSRLPNIFI
jgi:hypothetical protein